MDELQKNQLQEEKGMFQKTLAEKLELGKVGMTRLLDKLESKEIIERKRRGMNNFVVLKHWNQFPQSEYNKYFSYFIN